MSIEDKKDDEEELIVVEDESKLSSKQPAETPKDEPVDDDDDDEGGDKRIAASEEKPAGDRDDPEREAIKERRAREREARRERKELAIKRDKLELDFLRKRNDALERRVSAQEQRTQQVELGTYDSELAKAAEEIELAERVITKAVAAANGEDVVKALKFRDQALRKAQQLEFAKQQAAQQKPGPQAPSVDDLTMHYANEFIKENSWYDVHGRDEDSAIVLAIDKGLAKDGYDPQSEDYWLELRKRAARRLPDRFKSSEATEEKRAPRGGPQVGSGRDQSSTPKGNEFYLSPERKKALMDGGMWDDPALRMRYIKRYAEYDKAAKASKA